MADNDDMLCCAPKQVEPEIAVDDSPVVKEVLGPVSDLPNGAKKIYEVRDKKILVVNDNNTFYATSGLCTHFNWPLDTGFYHNGKIRCPLHGACFNMKNGDIEEYPGFDNLHAYEVKAVDGNLVLHTTEKKLESQRRTKGAKHVKVCKDHPVIVLGSGLAAANFVEYARMNGMTTPITMVTEEDVYPYDRVLVSKAPMLPADQIALRKAEYFKEQQIDILFNSEVTDVDTARRQITLANGNNLQYSKLVVATGGRVRKLAIPGKDLKNIFYLRKVQEGNAIYGATGGKHVVCIGASFIGMEIASALTGHAASITVICSTEEPVPAFGTDVGRAIRKRFEQKGVKIIRSANAVEIQGDTEVSAVVLKDGTSIPADAVVVGIGVVPCTDFLKNTSVKLDKRGFIMVDKYFRSSVDWVYAIGDVCSAPVDLWGLESHNIQHFQMAQAHGMHLGYTIVGKPIPKQAIPFFWSYFFNEFGCQFSGVALGDEETFVRGDIDALQFTKYYFRNGKVVAVAGTQPKVVAIQFIDLWQKDKMITKEEVMKNETDDWQKYLE